MRKAGIKSIPLVLAVEIFEHLEGTILMSIQSSSPKTNQKNDTLRYQNFAEFYPYYLSEHANSVCRLLHFIGTFLTLVILVTGLLINPYWIFAMPIIGYSFAWVGHFFIEKNRPATFTYPVWSLMGDYRMFFSWLMGRLPAQLKAAGVLH